MSTLGTAKYHERLCKRATRSLSLATCSLSSPRETLDIISSALFGGRLVSTRAEPNAPSAVPNSLTGLERLIHPATFDSTYTCNAAIDPLRCHPAECQHFRTSESGDRLERDLNQAYCLERPHPNRVGRQYLFLRGG